MISAVIFDFDGTLADLFEAHYQAFKEVVKERTDLNFEREDLMEGYGMVGEDILNMFFKKHGVEVDMENVVEIANERRVLASEKIGDNVTLLPGAEELLNNIKKAGLKIAIATSCSQNICDRIFSLPMLAGRFDAITTGTEVKEGKPHPEIFLKTAGKLDVKPEECMVFEDSVYGVKGARKAGMKIIAVTTGYDTKEELVKENPDRILESLVGFDVGELKS